MGRHASRAAFIAILSLAVAAFFLSGLHRGLDLAALRERLDGFQAFRAANPVASLLAFALAYVAMAALSLPGAAVMTVAAGAVFGLVAGTLVVSFASAAGATAAMLVSRTLLRDFVRARFPGPLEAVDRGLRQDGIAYLLGLRLVPLFPFWLVNLLLGLTDMPARTFWWVSQLGMLAGTAIYVTAGTNLARIRSMDDVLSPSLWLSLALLGIFPLAARRIVARAR